MLRKQSLKGVALEYFYRRRGPFLRCFALFCQYLCQNTAHFRALTFTIFTHAYRSTRLPISVHVGPLHRSIFAPGWFGAPLLQLQRSISHPIWVQFPSNWVLCTHRSLLITFRRYSFKGIALGQYRMCHLCCIHIMTSQGRSAHPNAPWNLQFP